MNNSESTGAMDIPQFVHFCSHVSSLLDYGEENAPVGQEF